MDKICIEAQYGAALSREEVHAAFDRYVDKLSGSLKKILLLPPDTTRKHSVAGWLTRILYHKLSRRATVTIMPATGTHRPMTERELADMFGDVPLERFIAHQWRSDPELLGIVPTDFVQRISSGVLSGAIRITVNRRVLSGEFDRIVSLGQVVPHEVVGMANYSKNVLVGCGGKEIIDKSHFLGAVYGLERLMGRDHSPVRRLYDYGQKEFLDRLPLDYVLTVNGTNINARTGFTDLTGIFIGRERKVFEAAVALSQKLNITRLSEPEKKFVVYLDKDEFRSTWIGCKAIYRTRLAVADGGEIVVIAPGLDRLGEDPRFDRLIHKHGYGNTERILQQVSKDEELAANLAVAAHLIHGSTEGRFRVTWAGDAIAKEVVEGVNFGYMSLAQAQERYGYRSLSEGRQRTAMGEDIYYINNPAAGLWVAVEKFET